MSDPTLPNLLIIGAAKSGTTSLHRYLDEHPQVSMSSKKEPNVFEKDDYRERALEYRSLFDVDADVRGESSTNYTKHPRLESPARKIAELIPESRLIYIVREPIERAVAHWAHNVAAGTEQRSIDAALGWQDESNVYVCASRYATQLGLYQKCFPADQLLVLDQRDLLGERAATLRHVFSFAGVDPEFESPLFDQSFNTRHEQRSSTALGSKVGANRLTRALRRALPSAADERLSHSVRQRLSVQVERPRMSDATRERLERVLRPEAESLRSMTGLGFESWSV